MKYIERKFVVFWWFVGWDCVQVGFHVCALKPNIEIHVPFGFFKIGWEAVAAYNCDEVPSNGYGWLENGWSWGHKLWSEE
jgi:hypothetical protein